LRDLIDLAVELGRRCLIEPGLLFQIQESHGFEDPQSSQSVGINRIFRGFERYLYMVLRSKIVNLIRLHLLDSTDEVVASVISP
jgi:hypothetical protein